MVLIVGFIGSRGKGLAKEAVQLMMTYASQYLGISKFRVKIDDSNSASLHLFQNLVCDLYLSYASLLSLSR
jgi:predicted acetyltransferase